jgi:hypothetical protein
VGGENDECVGGKIGREVEKMVVHATAKTKNGHPFGDGENNIKERRRSAVF